MAAEICDVGEGAGEVEDEVEADPLTIFVAFV